MKITETKGLSWKKLILVLDNIVQDQNHIYPKLLFWGENMRIAGIPTLGRETVDKEEMARISMHLTLFRPGGAESAPPRRIFDMA